MWRTRKLQTRPSGAIRALLAAALILGLSAASASASLLPPPDSDRPGLLRAWNQQRLHEEDGWIRGLHDQHWLPPEAREHGYGPFWKDEIRVLPESRWVIWIRRPAIFERFEALGERDDPWGTRAAASWPGALSRRAILRDDWLARARRESRRELLLEKALLTRRELLQEEARGSLFDFTIPINLPRGVERVVGRGEKSNITVTGRETITFGGETTRTNKWLGDESGRGQPLFPRLEMKQELDLRLSGTVGEKVHVEVENSSSSFGSKRQNIRIRYEGDEDEVIQLIEMGDTQLSLPSSGLISYSASNTGLFGVKMLGSLGDFEFTAIASKQEGELSSKTFNNTGQVVQSDYVEDINFLANQFFYLDRPDSVYSDTAWKVREGALNVFVEDHIPVNPQGAIQYAGYALADLEGDGLADGPDGSFDDNVRSFRLLEQGADYSVLRDPNQNFVGIRLGYAIGQSDILAVSYVAEKENGDTLHVGTVDLTGVEGWGDDQDIIYLELIKPEQYTPDSVTWDYMLRNVYSLGGRNIDYNTLEVEIHRVSTRVDPSYPEGYSQFPYLRIFGLDQYGAGNVSEGHDNKVDLAWVDEENGLLYFPTLRPFDPPEELVYSWTSTGSDSFRLDEDSEDRNADLYTVPNRDLDEDPKYNRFIIRFSSSTVSSRFTLNAFNIMEGSDVVTLDGQTLTRGTDYSIDYFSGEVELIGDAADRLTPDSRVSINYQYRPLIGGGKSSLVGLHGTYHLGDKSRISSSWLYESKFSGSRRPRLGEESTRNVVGNLLGNFQAEPEFLTRAVNLLPRVDTDAPSTVNLSGELALSLPNPNIDGEAFLDDMEGIEDADDLSLHRSQWMPPSEPRDAIGFLGGEDIPVTLGNRARAVYWFHPQQSTFREDFNLSLSDQESRETVDVLRLEVPVNLDEEDVAKYPAIDTANQANMALGEAIWTGLMRGFGGEGLDLSEAEYLEIWVNDFQQDPGFRTGRVHFDMGDISENWYFGSGDADSVTLNTEDVSNRGVFDELTEDTGLDNAFDLNEEPTDLPWANTSDPAGDDYETSKQDEEYPYAYFKVNGTEGNRRLDTEDMDGDGQLDTRNSYFSFSVDLDDEALIDMVEVYEDETGQAPGGNKAWRLYRLNLDEALIRGDGQEPDWNNIKYFRFWVEGFNSPGQDPGRPFNTLELASIKIVGNRWKAHGIQRAADGLALDPAELAPGEDLRVEVINTKDNATFHWPYGTEIDPETGLPEREQALNFVYDHLQPGHQALIRKDFQSLNLLSYRDISFYAYADTATVGHDLFFRAAFDSLNYYELVYTPEEEGWREINIKLTDWTDLKLGSEADTVEAVAQDYMVSSRSYLIRKVGDPDLQRVKSVFYGVRNNSGTESLSGQSWMNDIRVKDVRRDAGYAGKLSASANLANIISLNASFQETDPEFRGLRASSGSGVTNRSWSVNASSDLQNFLPLMGFRLPVSASHSRSASEPKYEPGSDVEITDEEIQVQNRSETVTQKLTLNLSRKASENWMARFFLDNLKVSGSVSQRRSTGPTRVELQESVNHSLSWQTSFKERNLNLPLGGSFRWLPQSLSLSNRSTRSWKKNWTAQGERFTRNADSRTGTMNNSASLNWNFFPSLRAGFNLSDTRDLEHELAGHRQLGSLDMNLGYQTSQSQGMTLDYTLPFFRKFRPKINFQSQYSQSVVSFAGIGGSTLPQGTLKVSGNSNLSTGYNLDVGRWIQKWTGGKKEAAPGAPRTSPAPPVHSGAVAPRVLVPVDPSRGPDPRQRRRISRRHRDEPLAKPEEAAEAASDSVSHRPSLLGMGRSVLRSLGGLKPLKIDMSRRLSSAFNTVTGSSALLYRFGLDEDPGMQGYVNDELVEDLSPDQRDETRTLKASTGMTLRKDINLNSNLEWSETERQGRSSHTLSETTKWPSLSMEVGGVEKWGIWGEMLQSSQVGVGYSHTLTETHNVGTGYRTRNEATTLTPHWSVTWRNKMRTNLTTSYNKTLNVQNTQTTKNTNLQIGVDWSYNLTAPQGIQIPGLKWLPAFKSRMDLNSSIQYTRSKNSKVIDAGYEEPLGGSSTLSIMPGASYQFSDKLTGGLTIRYSRNTTDLTGEVRQTFGLTLKSTLIF